MCACYDTPDMTDCQTVCRCDVCAVHRHVRGLRRTLGPADDRAKVPESPHTPSLWRCCPCMPTGVLGACSLVFRPYAHFMSDMCCRRRYTLPSSSIWASVNCKTLPCCCRRSDGMLRSHPPRDAARHPRPPGTGGRQADEVQSRLGP